MEIYKIFRAPEWEELCARGRTAGAPVDRQDGFVHFSTAARLRETCARHFAGEDALVLAAAETDRLGAALKWEPSRGGALFPHLYRELRRADISWHAPLPLGASGHVLPDRLR